jgi:NAD kinase
VEVTSLGDGGNLEENGFVVVCVFGDDGSLMAALRLSRLLCLISCNYEKLGLLL